MHPYVHSSTIYNSQYMETTEMFIYRRMDKENVVHIYTMEYYSAIKKRMKNAICSYMDGTRDYHTK